MHSTSSTVTTAQVTLVGSKGTTLAVSSPDQTNNLDQIISNFVATASGAYYLQVTSAAGATYSLVVTRNADLDAENNSSIETAQELIAAEAAGRRWAMGYLGGSSLGDPGTGPEVSLPTALLDASGFTWDIYGAGDIGNGTIDAYDGGLLHGGFPYFSSAITEDGGRELVIGQASLGDVLVTRKIFVPADETYARFLEIVTNIGTSSAAYTVPIYTNLGSDGYEIFLETSSGDNYFDPQDDWIVTDDDNGTSDPTLLHVVAGVGGMRPTYATYSPGELLLLRPDARAG